MYNVRFLQYFEHILQYLRSERYDHAFRVPESLPRDALAALATEAKFYNFVTLHQSLREALRKPPLVFQHKFLEKDVYTSWEEHGKQIQDLLRHGWELHDTSMSASNGNVHGLTRLILRSDHDRARNIT